MFGLCGRRRIGVADAVQPDAPVPQADGVLEATGGVERAWSGNGQTGVVRQARPAVS